VTFNSLQYALFLPVVLLIYRRLSHRGQNLLLLVASYIFYGAFDWRFLGLMWLSTLVDYAVGRVLARTDDETKRKRAFAASLFVNLGVLGFFKYFNFFVDSGVELLQSLGLNPGEPVLRILLPVGISFYTFHGISYSFDVYRRKITPASDLLSFAVFIAYFPQLVAGPIGRAHVQLPQFENPRPLPTRAQIRSGVFLILLGLFKKVAIADALAPYVNDVFAQQGRASWPMLIFGAYGFALQVYGDFSGYTDIARGSSRLFGVELLVNFEQPLLSRNYTQLWRTWHISLSTWLRDYLYVPLGGNRGGNGAMYRNLLITMTIGGLWHGAAWTFVIWGFSQGVFLVLHRILVPPHLAHAEPERWIFRRDVLATLFNFTMFAASLIIFRNQNFSAVLRHFKNILTLNGGFVDGNAIFLLLAAIAAVAFIDIIQRNSGDEAVFVRFNPLAQGAIYGTMILAVILFSGSAPVQFIYFQF
jgi:alginate O-acetyltransferase complex protein AlgI